MKGKHGKITLLETKALHKPVSTDGRLEALKHKADGKARDLDSAMRNENWQQALKECEDLRELLLAHRVISSLQTDTSSAVYVVGALFLRQCFRYLTQFDTEAVHFVTGPEVDSNLLLTHILKFRMSHRSWGSAVGDIKETHRILQRLDRVGYRLLAYFHTHPGKGPSLTQPSHTDLSMQRDLEKAGYPTIGGIFSLDGYIRFFSCDRTFVVKTYGNGTTQEEPNVFRLLQ